MPSLLPTPFLFRFSFAVPQRTGIPRSRPPLLDLPPECRIPEFTALDDAPERIPLDLRAGWNAEGMGFALHVRGRTRPPLGNPGNPTAADGLQLWLDTRNTQSVHRATRFCHHFCLMASGGGPDESQPTAKPLPIPRAREESPLCDPADLRLDVRRRRDGYDLEAWIPAQALHGFDPEGSPRLGWYFRIRDSELGDRYLSVGLEFPFATDPSLWSTLELKKG